VEEPGVVEPLVVGLLQLDTVELLVAGIHIEELGAVEPLVHDLYAHVREQGSGARCAAGSSPPCRKVGDTVGPGPPQFAAKSSNSPPPYLVGPPPSVTASVTATLSDPATAGSKRP
jgi:hypothetical protein